MIVFSLSLFLATCFLASPLDNYAIESHDYLNFRGRVKDGWWFILKDADVSSTTIVVLRVDEDGLIKKSSTLIPFPDSWHLEHIYSTNFWVVEGPPEGREALSENHGPLLQRIVGQADFENGQFRQFGDDAPRYSSPIYLESAKQFFTSIDRNNGRFFLTKSIAERPQKKIEKTFIPTTIVWNSPEVLAPEEIEAGELGDHYSARPSYAHKDLAVVYGNSGTPSFLYFQPDGHCLESGGERLKVDALNQPEWAVRVVDADLSPNKRFAMRTGRSTVFEMSLTLQGWEAIGKPSHIRWMIDIWRLDSGENIFSFTEKTPFSESADMYEAIRCLFANDDLLIFVYRGRAYGILFKQDPSDFFPLGMPFPDSGQVFVDHLVKDAKYFMLCVSAKNKNEFRVLDFDIKSLKRN